MIAQYEAKDNLWLTAPRQYALTQNHKHLKEMKAICSLEFEPIFCPIVSDFYSGMLVTVPLFASQLQNADIEDVKKLYEQKYTTEIVKYTEDDDNDGMLSAIGNAYKDSMQISVSGNSERILLTARYDNLGKGASGAAIEALNIVLGQCKTKGLEI